MIKQKLFQLFLPSFFCLVFLSNTEGQGDFCTTAVPILPGVFVADGPSSGGGCFNCSPGSPGGIAAVHADWYQFTPSSNGILHIRACNGGADTRLWVYSGDCNNLILVAANDDACDIGTGDLWASQIENLPVLAGVTYFLEWDDAWEPTGFTFRLEFSAIRYDAAIRPFTRDYFSIPDEQVQSIGAESFLEVFNFGSETVTGVVLNFQILETVSNSIIFESNSQPTEITAGSSKLLSLDTIPSLPPGSYKKIARLSLNEADDNPENNFSENEFIVSDNTYSIDDGMTADGLGVDGPGEIWQGQNFYFPFADQIAALSFNVLGGFAGDSLRLGIFETNISTGRPTRLLFQTDPLILKKEAPGWLNIPLSQPFIVEADRRYFVAVFHKATGTNLGLGYSNQVYLPNNCWISINGDPWVNPEVFDFQIAYQIQLHNGLSRQNVRVTVDMNQETVSPNGVYVGFSTNGQTLDTLKLTDLGNGLFSGIVPANSLSRLQYLFFNGIPLPENAEELSAECSEPFPGFLGARILDLGFGDVELPKVCFSQCSICPPPPCPDQNYLICDYFENYNLGNLDPQSENWEVWDGTGGDATVSNENAFSGTQSLKILGLEDNGGPTDLILNLGDLISGRYLLEMKIFVPTNRQAYYNIQHDLAPHIWASDVFFDSDGSGRVEVNGLNDFTFSYPVETWVTVTQEFDLDRDSTWFWVDGVFVGAWKFSIGENANEQPTVSPQLNGVNFYPLSPSYLFYVDHVFFKILPVARVTGTIKVDLTKFINDGGTISNEGIKLGWINDPGNLLTMTEIANNLWQFSGLLEINQSLGYNFFNGEEKEPTEKLENCGEPDGLGGYHRVVQVGISDFESDTVCFGYCLVCDEIIGLKEPDFDADFSVFPNPSSSKVTIKSFGKPMREIRLFDWTGKMVKIQQTQGSETNFSMENINSGVYKLEISTGDFIFTKLLVKQ